ncbi:ATP-dependent Clp protease proteolytic subunit [Amycolatopsis sp. NPDC059021]|uniref:ATP-dependent Clp protease proteolytic subunit n=1 Tax=Amycolatopsis sp. NPDC059021 TaxID=3346704 RepID=UPI00366E06DC
MGTVKVPHARRFVPSYVEHTSYGVKESNPYNRLYEDRIIFLGTPIDDASASDVMAQLLQLEGDDPDSDIEIYLNSPGGSLTAMMAIYDTMRYVRSRIRTVCLGQAVSAAALILAAGSPGMRLCLPNARVLIQQPAIESVYGHTSDLLIQAAELQRMRSLMESAFAEHTGKTADQVHEDIERAAIFTAGEALRYGLVDEVVPSRKFTAA